MKAILGTKIGMTQILQEDGVLIPVTLVQAGPCVVTQIKTEATDGYSAVQIALGGGKNTSKSVVGHVAKADKELAPRFMKEFRVDEISEELQLGSSFNVSVFEVGDKVKVTGTSKGKGFAGTVKRWNFNMQDATHGNSRSHRVPGSSGQCQTPGRVFKGKKMTGHLGAERVTVQNLEVVRVDLERNLILVKGAIPGAPGGDVLVRPAIKMRDNA